MVIKIAIVSMRQAQRQADGQASRQADGQSTLHSQPLIETNQSLRLFGSMTITETYEKQTNKQIIPPKHLISCERLWTPAVL